jgi:Holliday junction resolvase RusA-like endonuclease
MQKKIILDITPQTWVRCTQGDKVFFRIPEEHLQPSGLKRKKRIEKYNEYKACLYEQAKLNRFEIPEQGLCVTFYIPMPKTWRKWQRELFHFKLHQQTPDLSNFLKAFEDSICTQDKYIAHYGEIAKIWVDFPVGWIEITYTDKKYMSLEMPISKKCQTL